MNKNYKQINEDNMTITVSKDFLMKAGQFGTPEFFDALEMKKEGFRLVERKIKRNPDKRTDADLTYDKMKSFIEGYYTDEKIREAKLDEFESIKLWAKTQTAAYAKVKSWFKKEYDSVYEAYAAKEKAEKEMKKTA